MNAPHQLAFDAATHTYRVAGIKVPGVTQILRPLVDFSHVPPEILAAKANLGSRVHEACQFLDEDDLDEESVEEDVRPYLEAYMRFRRESGALVLLNEHKVFSGLYGYAGTLDRVFSLNGERWLVDLKTSISTPITTGPQTAAYLRALDAAEVKRRAALRLRPDGTYRLDELNDPNDWATFAGCLAIHRHMEKYA